MKHNSISDLLNLIQKRPAMYISRNSISCLKAFIDGWYFRDPDTLSDTEVMEKFEIWVKKKYKITETSHSWCDIILFYSQDEAAALITFFKDFNEWENKK